MQSVFSDLFPRVVHLRQHGIFSSGTPYLTYILLSLLVLLFVANISKNFTFLKAAANASFCFLSYAINATKLRQQLVFPDNYKQMVDKNVIAN
jgi:CHAT domain-containing protein